ncbi:hypothetical protein [Pseudomonas arsenicoxydans]|uniref:hypothetical protein n=1 Tax=Pseudomonas arsenicoxydans TaxID=702115 RepID=UPI00112A7387|nr:hypothetical protein [Pseudomonas arsenicoxydans]
MTWFDRLNPPIEEGEKRAREMLHPDRCGLFRQRFEDVEQVEVDGGDIHRAHIIQQRIGLYS